MMSEEQFRLILAVLTAQAAALEAIANNLSTLAIAQGRHPSPINWDHAKSLLENARRITEDME